MSIARGCQNVQLSSVWLRMPRWKDVINILWIKHLAGPPRRILASQGPQYRVGYNLPPLVEIELRWLPKLGKDQSLASLAAVAALGQRFICTEVTSYKIHILMVDPVRSPRITAKKLTLLESIIMFDYWKNLMKTKKHRNT